jgi:hypothetical protein
VSGCEDILDPPRSAHATTTKSAGAGRTRSDRPSSDIAVSSVFHSERPGTLGTAKLNYARAK